MADNLADVYLRFGDDHTQDIPGESWDAAYPHTEGWTAIKSFNFGFGWGGADSGRGEDAAKKFASGRKLNQTEQNDFAAQLAGHSNGNGSKGKAHSAEGTLAPKVFNFSRTPGVASKALIEKLRDGAPLDKAELIACRAAGVDSPAGPKDTKIPFLRLFFERLHLVKCSLSVSKEGPPSETVEFKFDKVTMETIWTENASGEKVPGGMLTVMYDFSDQEGRAHDEDNSWDVSI